MQKYFSIEITMGKFKKEICTLARFEFPSGDIRPSMDNGKRFWVIDIGCLGGGSEYKVKRNNPISIVEATKVFNKVLKEHQSK